MIICKTSQTSNAFSYHEGETELRPWQGIEQGSPTIKDLACAVHMRQIKETGDGWGNKPHVGDSIFSDGDGYNFGYLQPDNRVKYAWAASNASGSGEAMAYHTPKFVYSIPAKIYAIAENIRQASGF